MSKLPLKGIFGKQTQFSRGSITDALFVYLDGAPESESIAETDAHFRKRPLVCLTEAWKEHIETQCPDATIYAGIQDAMWKSESF